MPAAPGPAHMAIWGQPAAVVGVIASAPAAGAGGHGRCLLLELGEGEHVVQAGAARRPVALLLLRLLLLWWWLGWVWLVVAP